MYIRYVNDLKYRSIQYMYAGAHNYGKTWGGYNLDVLVIYWIDEQAKPRRPAKGVRGHAPPPEQILKSWCVLMHFNVYF